ncbi:MAG: aminotransferase class V-fold PLP-dependent enzyme [Pyrinomonadaceae bacterium]
MNQSLRALFPITRRAVYLNHAAVTPPPLPVVGAVEAQLRDVVENGSQNYRRWVAVKESARRLAAQMIGARPEQLAFMRNTSDGLSTIANGLKWRAGDNVVTFSGEFPSNVYPWLRLRDAFGVEIRLCPERGGRIDVDEMINLMDERTRVVAISSVQYASGFRVNLERLGIAARRRDALLVVDIIQAMGALSVDVESQLIDAAAGACHKWLLTPEGVGLLYLSDRALERLRPTLVGWVSVPEPEDYGNFDQPWREGALPWETGTGPTSLLHGLEASLKLLAEVGIDKIAAYLGALTDHLCDNIDRHRYEVISSRRPDEKSQIVCLRHTKGMTPGAIYTHLKRENIITAPRGGRLRISPHLYNVAQDIERLLEALP